MAAFDPPRQVDFGHVDRAARRAAEHEPQQLLGDVASDRLLRLLGRAADVRGEQRAGHADERAFEAGTVRLGLAREDVRRHAAQMTATKRLRRRLEIDERSAGVVDEDRPRLHAVDLGGADHALRARRLRHVQRDDVASLEQFVEAADGPRIAERELVVDVEEDDLHAEALGEHRELRADVAVADDAEHAAADLVASRGGLRPQAPMQVRAAVDHAAQQHHDLGEGEFRDAASVAEGAVEDGHAAVRGGVEIDLVRADAEAADRGERRRGGEHRGVELRARSDAEEVGTGDRVGERVALERSGDRIDLDAGGPQCVRRRGMHAFEEHGSDDVHLSRGISARRSRAGRRDRR